MKLMIFSGTTEGHDLCRFLSKKSVQADVFVATEYGAAVMEPMAGITVHEGRLDEREMEKRLTSDTLLIDATHPYAAAVTDNLRAACAKSGARYERLLRPALPYQNCEIVLDNEKVKRETAHYVKLPQIIDFTDKDGNDRMQEEIQANYDRIRQEVRQIVENEITRIKNDPELCHLIKEEE